MRPKSRAILKLLPAERRRTFLKCWTAKEAVLKAVGLGLSGSLVAFQVPMEDHAGQWLQVPIDGHGHTDERLASVAFAS